MKTKPHRVRNTIGNIIVYYLIYTEFALGLVLAFLGCFTYNSDEFVPIGLLLVFHGIYRAFCRPYRFYIKSRKLSHRFITKIICILLTVFVVAASFLYYLFFVGHISNSNMDPEKLFKIIALCFGWLIPLIFFAIQTAAVRVSGAEKLPKEVVHFVVSYFGLFLLYRAFIFLLTLISSFLLFRFAISELDMISIMQYSSGAEAVINSSGGSAIMLREYFELALQESMSSALTTGFLSESGTFVGSLTAASSYLVLSDLALVSIRNEDKTLAERVKRVFWDSDTKILCAMSVTSVGASYFNVIRNIGRTGVTTSGAFGWLGSIDLVFVASIVMIVLWLLSFIVFIKDTAIFPYIMILLTMGYVEAITPTSIEIYGIDVNVVENIQGFVLKMLVRIVLFMFLSILTGNAVNMFLNTEMVEGKFAVSGNQIGGDKARETSEAFYNGSLYKLAKWFYKVTN